jgi:hypothetical protein
VGVDIEEKLSKLRKERKRDFKDQVDRVDAVVRVVQAKEKIVIDPKNKYVRELIDRSAVDTLNDKTEVFMFRSKEGINKSGIQIMKRGKTKDLVYSKNSKALREYKELVRKIKEEPTTSTQAYTNEAFDDDEGATTLNQDATLNDPTGEDDTWENINGNS